MKRKPKPWRAPRNGGYSAVVPPGRTTRANPPSGPGGVSPAARTIRVVQAVEIFICCCAPREDKP